MAAGIKGFPTSSKQAMSARSLLGLNSGRGNVQGAMLLPHTQGSPDVQPVTEEIDDLKATYPGIFPGRIYNPKPSGRNMLQPFYPAPSNYFSLYPKEGAETGGAVPMYGGNMGCNPLDSMNP